MNGVISAQVMQELFVAATRRVTRSWPCPQPNKVGASP